MRLRFWEPLPEPPITTQPGHQYWPLPARRLNLTELYRFAEQMAIAVGAGDKDCEITRVVTGRGQLSESKPAQLEDLVGLLPEQRLHFQISASEPPQEPPVERPASVHLGLGDGLTQPALLVGTDRPAIRDLRTLWDSYGRPRYTWSWIYPVGFLLALGAAVAPLVYLWAVGELSLWFIPPVIALIALAFAVVSPLIQNRVRKHRADRAGLDIDYRLLLAVRTDRAARLHNLRSGFWGGLIGAVATLIGVWITVANQK